MKRTSIQFQVKNISEFKTQLLLWAQQFNHVAWLDSNNYAQTHSNFDALLAIDAFTKISSTYKNAFENLNKYQTKINDYIFGYLGYDLKNDIENLTSNNIDELQFPDLFFFQPKKIIEIKGNTIEFKYLHEFKNDIESDLNEIKTVKIKILEIKEDIKIKLRIHKDAYLNKVSTVLKHIHRGDIYEANFCQEFYCENAAINPLEVFQNLNSISKPPFASFLKFEGNYLISASPERYLKKQNNFLISQPIKGTEKRDLNIIKDQQLAIDLAQNKKERAENIMIVDLVRNDLSKIAIKGSVKVEELCKIYTFKQVHQLISTVSCVLKEKIQPVAIIKATFPMGSMTGAPKIAAMKIIEELEESKRGLYSGAIGYFTPENNFDFNVIIRSILYNETKKYISFSVGSAITSLSEPEKEYEECLLKAKAMREVLLKKGSIN